MARRELHEKHEEMVTAATELFSLRGYRAASMRDIAEAVGLQPGSLYAHIETKEDLLFEIATRAAEQFENQVVPVLQDETRAVTDRLRAAMQAHLKVVTDNLRAARVFFHEWQSLEGGRRSIVVKQRNAYEAEFVKLIEKGIRAGELRAIDSHLVVIAILSLLNWSYQWFSPAKRLTPKEVADTFADYIFGGIVAPNEADSRAAPRKSSVASRK